MSKQEDIIDSYIDRAGFESDTAFALGELNKLLNAIKAGDKIKVDLGKSVSMGQVTSNLREYEKVQVDVMEANRKLAEQQKKSAGAQRDLDKALIEGRVEKQKYNAELKKEIELQNSSVNSINQARAANKILLAERNSLNLATEQGRKRLAELNNTIDQNNEFIKQNVDALSKQKINIGNYEGSAKIVVNALGKLEEKMESLRQKQAQLQDLSKSNPIGFQRQGGNDNLNQITGELKAVTQQVEALQKVTSQPQFLNLAGSVGDARKEIRGFTTTLVQLEQQGLGNTSFANELRERLAELTDQVADTRQEIKALSSDSRAFDLFAGSVSFLADSFQTAAGAAVLLGASEEDAAEATRTLIAVQSVANGVKGIANELTTKGTAANKALTYVQAQYAIVTNTATTATARLGAAMRLLAPLAIVGAVILIVSKLKEWSDAAKNTATRQKVLNDVAMKAADSYGQEKASLDTLITSLKTEGLSKKEKFALVEKLQAQFPGYFDNIKTEEDLNNKLTTAYKKAAEGILLKAKAQAASSLLAENETKKLKAQLKYEQEQESSRKLGTDLALSATTGSRDSRINEGIDIALNQTKKAREAYVKEVGEIDKANKVLIQSIQDSNNQIEKLGGKVDGTEDKTGDKDTKEKEQERLLAEFEAFKQIKQRQAEMYKKSAEDENLSYQERLMNLGLFVKAQQAVIADQAAFDLANKKLTEDQKKVIAQKAIDEQIKVAEEAIGTLTQIEEDAAERRKELFDVEANEQGTLAKVLKAKSETLIAQWEKEDKVKEMIAERDKKRAELEQELYDRKIEFAKQAFEAIAEFATFGQERELNAIQSQIDALEAKKAKEIEVINQTVSNEQNKAAQIAVVEARATAQKEQLEKKQRDIEVKKAQFEKITSIMRIAISTAEQVFKIKAQAAVLASNPVTAPLVPIALAQIPIVIGGGAIAAAVIAARPIPRYFKGKNVDDFYEGPALLNDGGKREAIIREDGRIELPQEMNTIQWVGKKDIVLPDAKMLAWDATKKAHEALNQTNIIMDNSEIVSELKANNRLLKAIKNKQDPRYNIPGIIDIWIKSNKNWEDLRG